MKRSSQQDPTLSSAELDDLFAASAGQGADVAPSQDLMARIMADAQMAIPPVQTAPTTVAAAPPVIGWLGNVLATIGGVPGAAGLAVAGISGVMIGVADPTTFDTAAAWLGLEVVAYDVDDLFATFPTLAEDG